MMNNPLVFYDGHCPLCNQAVSFLMKIDPKKQFIYAPIEGEIAPKVLGKDYETLKGMNTIIFVESRAKRWIRAKAVFRIFFLIGGVWKILGVLYVLPRFLIDPPYILVARLRYRLKRKS